MWVQRNLTLSPYPRGFHLITREVIKAMPELAQIRTGLLHVFIQHTSASLSINENADPGVRGDFERFFHQCVPENADWCQHLDEGPDDMPAHIKSSLMGASVMVPVQGGHLALGTWQGIYLGEHRNHGGARRLILTLQGQ